MKNYAYAIICMAILFAGCSRTTLQREKTKETIQTDRDQHTQIEKSQATTEDEVIAVKSDSNSYSIFYEFDTEKPLDKSTGLPPVKSICFTGSSKKEEKAVNKTVNQKESLSQKQSTKLKKKATAISDATNKTKTKTEFPWTLLFLTWLSAAIFWQVRGPFIKAIYTVIKKIWKG